MILFLSTLMTFSNNTKIDEDKCDGNTQGFNPNACEYHGCAAEVGILNKTFLCYQMPQDASWTDEGTRAVCPCNN